MKQLLLKLIVLVSIASQYTQANKKFEFQNGLLVMNSKNYEIAQIKYEKLAILFSQDNQQMIQQFEKVAEQIATMDAPITLARYNLNIESKKFPQNFKIKENNSTILILSNGISKGRLVGIHQESQQLEFILQFGLPSEWENLQLAQKTIDVSNFLVVFFAESQESERFQLFQKLKRNKDLMQYKDIKTAYTTSPEIRSFFNISGEQIVIFRKFEQPRIDIPFQLSEETLMKTVDFIESMSYPVIKQLSLKVYERIFLDENPAIFFWEAQLDNENESTSHKQQSQNEQAFAAFKQAAEQLKNHIWMVHIDQFTKKSRTDQQIQRIHKLREYLKIDLSVPQILIVNHKDTSLRKYPIKDIYNFDDIVKTFDLYKNKKIKSYLVSQQLWESVTKKNLLTLVGDNFEQVVRDQTKHVFVNFYSSKCGRSAKFQPDLEDLAVMFSNRTDIIIAKFDLIQNDHRMAYITRYPTQKLFLKNQKSKSIIYQWEKKPPNATVLYNWIISHVDGNLTSQENQNDIKTDL